MFRAQTMFRVTLWLLASEAADAALLLARHGVYAPAPGEHDAAMPEAPAEPYREVFLEAESRLSKILEQYRHHLHELACPTIPVDAAAPNLVELEELNEVLKNLWQACSATNQVVLNIEEERRHLAVLRETFARLEGLDVEVSRLFRPDSLLDARLGLLPVDNVQRLKESLALAKYLLAVFDGHDGQVFAVVAGPRGGEAGMGGVLSQAGWRDLPVPEELQRRPEAVRQFLDQEEGRLEAAHAAQAERIVERLNQSRISVERAFVQMSLARPLAMASQHGVRGKGGLATFSGWVPKQALGGLQQALDVRFQGRCLIAARKPGRDEHAQVPSLLRYPACLHPFLPLVQGYGIPRYGEFDPAALFALTYLLLFGAMFGDVGHGGVILLLALLFRRKLGKSTWIGVTAGLSAMGFGLLYGSIFGLDDVLSPIWLSPMRDPIRVITLAILFGMGFITFTLLANIGNKLISGRLAAALFDSTGLAGLLFYLGVAGGMAGRFGVTGMGTLSWSMALVGILIVAAFKWWESRGAIGERALITAIETLETGIKLFANTLSFMRVAAFSLNHVALALAVFSIAGSLGTVGHGLTILLGNGVIILLEGGIVAIQALRLMYYEGFSRFFNGDGIEFVPLKLAASE